MVICYVFFVLFLILLTVFSFLELHYFLRCLLYIILARISRKKTYIMQETSITGFCFTNDIDFNITHMNNARFLRELDFAKVDFNERTGLYRCIKKHGGALAMGATTIRYRRFIKLFTRYIIKSKIVYWDEQTIFMEHRFLTPPDNFINAIVLCRVRLTNCNAEEVMNDLLVTHPENDVVKIGKPEMPPEVAKWIESNDISSEKLRRNTQQPV